MKKKKAILDATLALVTANGFHATPMSMVAEKAEVAAGTIYHYFDNKNALISELYLELLERMGNALINGDDDSLSIKSRYYNFWLNLFKHFISNSDEFYFLEQYSSSPFSHQQTKVTGHRHFQAVNDLLETGMNTGELKQMPAALITSLMHASVATTVKMELSGELDITKDHLQTAVDACWDFARI